MTPSRTRLIAAAGVAAALAASAPAGAQDANQDPSPGSPSGTVYEIPLDQGRGDAAPRSAGGGNAGGGGSAPAVGGSGSPGTSSIRSSDNGSGSTSVVPGASSVGGGERAGKRERDGKARSAPGERDVAPSSPQAEVVSASAGSPSIVRSALLIVLGVAIAAALGVVARRQSRRSA